MCPDLFGVTHREISRLDSHSFPQHEPRMVKQVLTLLGLFIRHLQKEKSSTEYLMNNYETNGYNNSRDLIEVEIMPETITELC